MSSSVCLRQVSGLSGEELDGLGQTLASGIAQNDQACPADLVESYK